MAVSTSGKTTVDFLVQVVFITALLEDGSLEHCTLYRDPIILKHGKASPAWAACGVRCPGMLLPSTAPASIVITRQVHDRGVALPLRQAIAGLRRNHFIAMAEAEEKTSDNVDMLHWTTSVGCSAHDARNSLRWAHQTVFGANKELLKRLYVGIRSLQTGDSRGGRRWCLVECVCVPSCVVQSSQVVTMSFVRATTTCSHTTYNPHSPFYLVSITCWRISCLAFSRFAVIMCFVANQLQGMVLAYGYLVGFRQGSMLPIRPQSILESAIDALSACSGM